MNREEELAREFLASFAPGQWIHEPDGNVPPDFSLNQKIAVEVTRMSKNILIDGRDTNLETDHSRLIRFLERVFQKLGQSDPSRQYFVSVKFKRPINLSGPLKTRIRRHISNFSEGTLPSGTVLWSTKNLRIQIIDKGTYLPSRFEIGAVIDEDASGWVLSDISENLTRILTKKAAKIEPYLQRYDQWWLVLVDHIGYGNNERHLHDLRKIREKCTSFSRVFSINPIDPQNYCEI